MRMRFRRKAMAVAVLRSPAGLAQGLVLLICIAIIGLTAWRVHVARDVELRESRTTSANLARAFADHANATLEAADILVAGTVERLVSDGVTNASMARLRTVLAAKVGLVSRVRDLIVFDAEGAVLASSLPTDPAGSAADREYFAWHRTHAESGPHFGPPVRGRHNGHWTLTVSRRVDAPGGALAGIVVATVDFATFSQFYASFDIGPNGTIVLASEDGTLLVRVPEQPGSIGTNLSGGPLFRAYRQIGHIGNTVGVSSLDGVIRHNSFRKVDGYPFVVGLALSQADILRQWRTESLTAVLIAGAIALTFGVLGLHFIAMARRSDELLRRANERLQRMVMLDGLTGISNRRCFDVTLENEGRRCARSGSPLAILLIDVDHFKSYNDRYGHPAGDACLRSIATMLGRQMRRPADLVARYGGEEFVVLLPQTEIEGAVALAEKVRAALHRLAILHHASPSHAVTVSIGVAVAWPGRPEHSADRLIEVADMALYAAKRGGRDQVRLELMPNPPTTPANLVAPRERNYV